MYKPIGFGLVAAALLWRAGFAVGQEAGAPAVQKMFSKSVSFRLPVQIDDHDRAELRELKLYVKTPTSSWVCRETAPPTQRMFSFRAPGDGEYWFVFALIGKNGQVIPENIDQATPGLVVVVDTQPPAVEVRTVNGANGQVYLYGTILDANPDYSSMKVEFLEGSQWKPLTMLRDCPGAFLDTDPKAPAGRVRVFAADRAGNSVTREIELQSSAATTSSAQPNAQPVLQAPSSAAPAPLPALPAAAAPSALPAPILIEPKDFGQAPSAPDVRVVSNSPPGQRDGPFIKTGPAQKETPAASNVPVINSLRCRLDFSLDGKVEAPPAVEVWATADNGKTWMQCGESPLGRSPAVVSFPQDGLYGFLFAAKSSTGSLAPRPGTTPDGWVEVDTTKPTVEIQSVKFGAGAEAADLIISWIARDRNLGPEPINIYYSAQLSGTWYPIAMGVTNSGKYRWTVPTGLARVYVRVEATDRAGNVARCETPEAIAVECARIPVKVLNIAPATESDR